MIYLNGRRIMGFERETATGGCVGFWPWSTDKWRYFYGFHNGELIIQNGPHWLSDDDAFRYGFDLIVEAGRWGRFLNPLYRFDWNPNLGAWSQVQHPTPSGG